MDQEAEVPVEALAKDPEVKAEAPGVTAEAKVPEVKVEVLVVMVEAKDLAKVLEARMAVPEVKAKVPGVMAEAPAKVPGVMVEMREVEGIHIPGSISSDIKSTNLLRTVH
jgi:hypothetical protein